MSIMIDNASNDMSRGSSPPGSSDDSAVGSMTSNLTNSIRSNSINRDFIQQTCRHNRNQTKSSNGNNATNYLQITKPISKSQVENINSDHLVNAAKQMRRNNVGLISRSIRTNLCCFDEFDVTKFETNGEFFINFISNGIHKCDQSTVLRPVSVLWPDNYDSMTETLGILDAFLLNTQFYDKPVEWMLKRGLTSVPSCRLCRNKMSLDINENLVRWQCKKTIACTNFYVPIQRPSFFAGYESIGLKKLLFSVYFWATCTPAEDLSPMLNLDMKILNGIWRRIQNVCRTALEKSYPRHRLTDCADQNSPNDKETRLPIDLISIKLNKVFIVCAKHPSSNFIRVGLHIPNVSMYSFAELTESWFAHGATIRVSERKFLNLAKKRSDLKLQIVPKPEMIGKNGKFDRSSAFGYLITQLTHVFKDYDSSGLSIESLKLMLAELQWREHYGITPYDAFTNIINHMTQYGESSDTYSEVSLPLTGEETYLDSDSQIRRTLDCTQYMWTEKYFYATIEPLDEEGNVISRKIENLNPENNPHPNALITCHICSRRFECFDFGIHLMHHIEDRRNDSAFDKELAGKKLIECKHCFKTFKKNHIVIHSTLLRSFLQPFKFGCRICCIKLDNREEFLQHMRCKHFEHETPYRCPICKFASSFQRDVFLHFSEEHRHKLIILCSLCLTSFTVGDSIVMNSSKMKLLSKVVYNHLAEHYHVSRNNSCSNCCLCFVNKEKLEAHIKMHHNPCESREFKNLKMEPFVIDYDEEKFCTKALPAELFIANKRPNVSPNKRAESRDIDLPDEEPPIANINLEPENLIDINEIIKDQETIHNYAKSVGRDKITPKPMTSRDDNIPYEIGRQYEVEDSNKNELNESNISPATDEGLIHVRGVNQFLEGGNPALTIQKNKQTKSANMDQCSSRRLIEYLSRMKKADGIIANQSVVLTPLGKPAKCVECLQYITVDHYVSPINCLPCRYTTLCPRAATAHYRRTHGGDK